jgi:L-iditol 2-dehydrogenase
MKAAQLMGPKRFEFVEVETPKPNEGESLVRLEYVSICGSDIRHGYGPVYPEESYPLGVGKPCHECAGVVVESRSDEFRVGQRVIAIPPPTAAVGGLAEYVVCDTGRLIALPDHGALSEWVMCQPSGTVLFSCQKMGTILGQSILVLGQGAIGLSFSMLLSQAGARQVIAADLFDYRLEYSKEFGATHTINPSKQDIVEAVNEITEGVGPDITVEAAGYPDTLNLAFRLVRVNGTVIIFGMQSPYVVPVDTNLWFNKQPTIIPTSGGRSADATTHIKAIVGLRERGLVDPARMVTHRLGFNADDVNKAYDMYENQKDNVVKVVMGMSGS